MTQTSDKVKEFCQQFKKIDYPQKKIIITPSHLATKFYYLEAGYIRNFISTKEGNELSINIFCNNTLLPFISLFNETALLTFYYETITKSIIRVIPKIDMMHFLEKNSDVREEFALSYVNNINLLLGKTKELIYHDTNYRIISTLIHLGDELGCIDQQSVNLKVNISHELIASFAGTTRETVTRKLNELKQKGYIINKYSRLKIIKLTELKKILAIA